MNQHPSPLTPEDCDLRDFQFMPLDVVRLRDSDIAAVSSGDEFRCAVLLWCAAWHQIPAGSLPDDDIVLSQLAGFGRVVKEWKRHREGAMRGWIKCSDGRLYHPVVAEKAREAWMAKLEQRWRTECGRIKKHNQRHATDIPFPDFSSWINDGCPQGQPLPVPRDIGPPSIGTTSDCPLDVPREIDSKGQGEGQGQGQGQGLEIHTVAAAPPDVVQKKYSMRADLLDRGIPEQIADDWLECRKKKKLANTRTAMEGVLLEAEKAGMGLEEALTICCKQGWGGFKASWLQNDPSLVAGDRPWDQP